MEEQQLKRSGEQQGRLWGLHARDWAEIQESMFVCGYDAVFDRIPMKGIRYLDAGCGAGLAAKLAADRGASVFGLDAASNLLDIARTRVPSGDFLLGELEELPYPDNTFDLVTGFNSLQFAARPAVAFREARRVSKPGGLVAIMTWGEPVGMEWATVLGALKSITTPPPPGTPGPFALSEKSVLWAMAQSAGLEPKEVFDVEGVQRYPNLETALQGLMSSGNATRAIEQSNEEAVRRVYTEALTRFRQPDDSYKVGTRFRCLVACK